ncbi:MAG: zinc-ribbon domain-containing protein, partial [Proteobacteria bacterium]|nr:zinc-ribbon domain-containing protein [Pseudomonadota bacterium]
MHLTCPSCGVTFLVEPEHLGPTGRRVRCGECGHVWHQERPSEADAAERSAAKAAAAPFAPREPAAKPAAKPEPTPEPAAKPEPAPEP